MRLPREHITLPAGHSFRVLRWHTSPREADVLLGPGQSRRIRGEGARWHYHPEMELTLFTAGDGTRFVGDHIGPFAAGDLVLLGERVPHHWLTRGPSAGMSVQWYFPKGHPLWAMPEALELGPLFAAAARGLLVTGDTAAQVRAELRALPETTGLGRLIRLLGVLDRLRRARPADVRPLSRRSFSLPTGSAHRSRIQEAILYLTANFRDVVRLEDVLRVAGMSKATFARQFKRHAGRTFTDFLAGVRLDAVCRELRETDAPVTDIAHAAGFTQISFFNRLFRRRLGCNPRQYRLRPRTATPRRRKKPRL